MTVERVLERMCAELPTMMTDIGYQRRTCILHTRIATTALRELGYRARPLACRLRVFNQAYADRMAELGRHLQGLDEYTPETWSIGIGYGSVNGDGYDAHVVTVVQDRYLLDLTLDQASRPQRNINLRPGYMEVSKAFLRGDEPDGRHVNDAYIVYEATPEDKGFLAAPDWVIPGRNRADHRRNPTSRLIERLAA